MRVVVAGGTGHSGSYSIPELIAVGHEVTALARSDTAAGAVAAFGAGVRRGYMQDLDRFALARIASSSPSQRTWRVPATLPAGRPAIARPQTDPSAGARGHSVCRKAVMSSASRSGSS